MRVHITGFDAQEKEDLKSKAIGLGLHYDENFTCHTEMLICDFIMNAKYKIAKIRKILIVSKNWLLKSAEHKRLLETKEHEYGILEGLKIHFFGFDAFKLQTLKDIVRNNKGTIVKDLNKILTGEESVNFIVVRDPGDAEKLLPVKNKVFIVTLNWLYQCMKYGHFINPDAFVLPFCSFSIPRHTFKIKMKDLERCMEETESNAELYNILNDCIFYIPQVETSQKDQTKTEELDIVTRLICLMSGFSTRKPLRTITHVLANTIDEEEKEKLSKNGTVHFVNNFFLIECLLYKKRLLEIDYPTKVVESQGPTNPNSRNDSRNSNVNVFRSRTATPKMPEFKSFLFENVLFYFDSNLKKGAEYRYKVFENSGSILLNFDGRPSKCKEIFHILEDGFDQNKIPQSQRSIPGVNVYYVSPRWIDYCLERKVVLRDFKDQRMTHLLPFPHPTPYQDFQGVSIAVRGFEEQEKYVLQEIIKILGGSVTKFVEEDESQYKILKECSETEELSSRCKNARWIFDCIMNGKFME
jgi:hypothetical protein